MIFLARVFVSLKPTVNDPEGQTIHSGLRQLGFSAVDGVRTGKYIEIRLRCESEKTANSTVAEMCQRLLANPVIENCRFDLEHLADQQ